MNEQVHVFGESLIGILAGEGADRPAVLFWNAGLLHRVGPYRNFVDVARALAADGFRTFRFDLGGLGDSPAHKDARSDEQRARDDLAAAMDFVTSKTGIERFILFGLCSGAYQSHPIARDDERVVGAVLLDGFAWPTRGSRWRHLVYYHGRRMLRPSAWQRFIKGKLDQLRGRAEATPTGGDWMTAPDVEAARSDFELFRKRGTHLLFVYTGGYVFYNYREQFRDAFGDFDNIRVEYFEQANHTYVLRSDREKLNATILDWIRSV